MSRSTFRSWLPWLHPHRADVLAALALAMRLRQPLASGFTRLADGDPLLQAWAMRLSPDLASGAPLGGVLRKHRLLDRRAARRLDSATDPVGEFENLSQEQLVPLHGMTLIRWFPVYLVAVILGPLAVVQTLGISQMFEKICRELGMKLPAITDMMLSINGLGLASWVIVVGVMWSIIYLTLQVRVLRHLCHLWWVDVHRQAALYALTCAAVDRQDAPQRLRWRSWLAVVRLSSVRQMHPAWDQDWRTWRILTRLRALGPGWKIAARSSTAAEVLSALGFLPTHADPADLVRVRDEARQHLLAVLQSARAQAHALLMLGVAMGATMVVLAFFLPLFSLFGFLGSWP